MIPRTPFALMATCLIAALLLGDAQAQLTQPSRPFSVLMREWKHVLDKIENTIQTPERTSGHSRNLLEPTRRVYDEATAAKLYAEQKLDATQRLLDALGPPPGQEQAPESGSIAQKRLRYNGDIADYRARATLAELTITRAKALEQAIIARSREQQIADLFKRFPSPYSPHVIAQAVPEFIRTLGMLVYSPADWFHGLEPQGKTIAARNFVIALLFSFGIGWGIRRILLRRFGRDPTIENPSYARRLVAAIAESVARGMTPALAYGTFLYISTRPGTLASGLFAQAFISLWLTLSFYTLTIVLTRAVFAPDLPNWRLTTLTRASARTVNRRILYIATIFAFNMFFTASLGHQELGRLSDQFQVEVSDELKSFISFFIHTLLALGILGLAQRKIWRVDHPQPPPDASPEAEVAGKSKRFWAIVRWLSGATAITSIVANFLGYVTLCAYLIDTLLLSAMAFGLLLILHTLGSDLIELFFRSTLSSYMFSARNRDRRMSIFWSRMLVDSVIFVIGLLMAALIASLWGISLIDLWRWLGQALTGITIGSITLSLSDVALAILVFVLVLTITRFIKRALLNRVLPQTGLATNVQHSIAAGTGYIGVTLAIILGVAALGISLSNIALIASALSVGIGFGLKNVANNFISGLILLFERPLKVGDWIVLGDQQGFVKDIKIRATEIETFERASVIVPNADILSNALVNWTHQDRYGRVDVRIGVAYGATPVKVRDILINCARRHPQVLYRSPFMPYVLFQNFGPLRLEFELRCFTDDITNRLTIASDLRYDIRRRFKESHIEIPFPQQVVHLASSREGFPR